MTRTEQTKFVAELTQSILEDVYSAIDSGELPEEWDGIELRQYLADKFTRSVFKLDPKRRKAYNNTITVTNL